MDAKRTEREVGMPQLPEARTMPTGRTRAMAGALATGQVTVRPKTDQFSTGHQWKTMRNTRLITHGEASRIRH